MLASLAATPIAAASSAAAAEASSPLAVIVVGPVGSRTAENVGEGRRIAAQLKSYGARVREVYSPNATWSRVAAATRGAHLLVYLGAGRGYPGPYGAFDSRSMDGLGLNRTSGSGHGNTRHYGEHYVGNGLRLARGAIVLVSRVPYAAGSSGSGPATARWTAAARADNYASGFLRAGASAVFASDHAPASTIRDLFGAHRTMQSVFWRSPWTSARYDSTFRSTRTSGARGILAPYSAGRYNQSVVGRLATTTSDWRRSWSAPPSGTSVKVSSVPALLDALADDRIGEIVVADGTYRVSPASSQRADSLWIGKRFAGRTQPVLVRAETRGGVVFDGGGSSTFGGLTFAEGAHHQTWDGFTLTNGRPTQTGAIVFGGYAGRAAPHHITLRNFTVAASVTGGATSASAQGLDHAIYVSQAVDGPHDLVFEDIAVDGRGGLASALVFYHSDASNQNAWNVTVRRLHVTGTQQAIILWDPTLRDITIDTAVIQDALSTAVTYESQGASGIVLANITSTGSGSGKGFYSSLGTSPLGVTFVNNSFR